MDANDDVDLDKLIQEELDALSLDDPIDDNIDDKEADTKTTVNAEEEINETRRVLEHEMRERLAAFENEINSNLHRYEIDYSEIDELLQKPVGGYENELQTKVAVECGIEREELDRILQSINAEESPLNSTIASETSEFEERKIPVIENSLPTTETDESVASTPREQQQQKEDPNKKIFDERLAESHRRMLDELALLEQKRKEEEERYAIVLQEQQARLAEEYHRLQETLDESVRQTQNEKLQFESLCREQERLTNKRQHKMATLIQAWYRGKRVYRRYHVEIQKRVAPVLKTIAKKRKKKEQEELANAAKLTKIQEDNIEEKENEPKTTTTSIPPPKNNRISSPLSIKEIVLPKEEAPKKIKIKQPTPIVPRQINSKPSLPITQIVQLEDPADFVPTIVSEQRRVSTPRITQIENKSVNNIRQIASPISIKERSKRIVRSGTFEKESETPAPPSIEHIPTIPVINRSDTFVSKMEDVPPVLQPPTPPVEIVSPAKITRSDTFVNNTENSSLSNYMENRSDTFISKPETPPQSSALPVEIPSESTPDRTENLVVSHETIPVVDILSIEQPEIKEVKIDIPPAPKVTVEGKHPIKAIYSFLNEARRWSQQTRDITYSNLILSTEEFIQHLPSRKTGGTLRKLVDIDVQVLTKAAKSQLPKEIHYLLLEQLLTPCSLSLVGTTYPNLTHLTLRQCKLVQLVGLESCSSLIILDVEGNWLEQIHLQLNHLEYLNMSRNRVTSLLSLNTPRLKYLNVSKNRLTRLNGLESLTNLNVLLATSNQLLTTIGLQGCTHLLHIDVSDNHLVEMEQLDQCPLLITVKATSNALIQIPNLFNAILLNELDLSSNSLTTFDELSIGSWLPFLTHLRLANNGLQELSMIKLPALNELDLGFNQISDVSIVKRFIKTCPQLARLNLEQNPVLCDLTEGIDIKNKDFKNPLSLLPQLSSDQSTESIELYLNFLSNLISLFILLRQTIEQYQIEPFDIMNSIQNQCQQYSEQKIVEPIVLEIAKNDTSVILSPEEQSIVRLQAHWRRRLAERNLNKRQRAAKLIQARWRGYAVRQRMRNVRRLYSQQRQQTFDEVDLTEFDFDEAAFDARFQRPHTPATRIRQVWQPQQHVLAKTTTFTELPLQQSPRSSSVASSRAKPVVEPLSLAARTNNIATEWGFTPSSTTAALMLKRAEKMKWNAERKQKRQHMDAYQRLQMARNNEQPPGSLRLARRQQTITNTGKPAANIQHFSPPSTSQSRPNRVFEWVHTQVAQFDGSSVGSAHSPRNERKRLPSLDGSFDSYSRMQSNETIQQQQQQQRWSTSTVSVRQPPPLLPPINGHLPRF